MIGLIMVASMVPGLLIGLWRTTAIDYDAVAYRTGAILVEDPGWPDGSSNQSWELNDDRDNVERLGLAVSKDNPGILSILKIEKLYGPDLAFIYPDDYRQRIIFGDYPYRFNITLRNETGPMFTPLGDPLPGLTGYGYIRRAVKVKDYATTSLDLNSSANSTEYEYQITDLNLSSQNFTVRLDKAQLMDSSISPAYQFDPKFEPIILTITNFKATLNNTDLNNNPLAHDNVSWNTSTGHGAPTYATLETVKFYKNSEPAALPMPDDIYYSFTMDGVERTLTPNERLFDNIHLIVYPSWLYTLDYQTLDMRFTFKEAPSEPPHTFINGTYGLNYTTLERPPLDDAWLEVAVW